METENLAKWHQIEAEITEAEALLQDLKLGLSLGYRKDKLLAQSEGIANLRKQLDTIEGEIANYLFGWSALKVPFWQIVRFTGLGLLLGFALRGCT
jgi:hypothetical protein